MKIKVSACEINSSVDLQVEPPKSIGMTLGSGGGIPSILQKESVADFPGVGKPQFLYVAMDTGKSYVWDDTNFGYLIVGTNYEDIKVINGGLANG